MVKISSETLSESEPTLKLLSSVQLQVRNAATHSRVALQGSSRLALASVQLGPFCKNVFSMGKLWFLMRKTSSVSPNCRPHGICHFILLLLLLLLLRRVLLLLFLVLFDVLG